MAENFTGYTEVDVPGGITIDSATKVSWDIARNEEGYIYSDKGAGHFSGDFVHLIDFLCSSSAQTGSTHYPYALTLATDDINGLRTANSSYLALNFYRDTASTFDFYLYENDTSTLYSDVIAASQNDDTVFYLEIERDESVGTYGTLYARVYSDAARTTLVDTLSVTLHSSKKDFRYVQVTSTYNDGNVQNSVGYVENLNLQEFSLSRTLADSSGLGHQVQIYSGATVDTGNTRLNSGSLALDGSGYLQVPDSSSFSLSKFQFTIDAWIYPSVKNVDQYIISHYADANNRWYLMLTSNNRLKFGFVNSGSEYSVIQDIGTGDIQPGQWYHVAVTRNGNTFTLYKTGLIIGQSTIAQTINDYSGDCYIGQLGDGSGFFTGNMDEVRIYKGVPVWNQAFLPPRESHTGVLAEDVLLLKFEGADASTTFDDSSKGFHVPVANGAAQIDTADFKFGSSSLLLDATAGTYVSIPTSDDFYFTGDFTIDLWVNFPTPSVGSTDTLIGDVTVPGSDNWANIGWVLKVSSGGTVQFQMSDNGSAGVTINGSTNIKDTGWRHVAIVRNGNVFTLYLDGLSEGTTTSAITALNSSNDILIGYGYTSGRYIEAWMDEIRITKGLARWTDEFVPPQEGTPALTYPIEPRSETVLLVHGDNDDQGSTIPEIKDYSASDHNVILNGGSFLTDTQSKFGGGVIGFDGTGHISVADNTDFSFGTGDFTIDLWVRYISHDVSNYSDIIGKATDANNFWRLVTINNTGGNARKLYFGWYEPSAYKIELLSTTQMDTGTWHHVAVVRRGTTFTLYVDGVLEATDTHADSIPQFTGDLVIGKNPYGANEYFDGYIDEVRITKGTALFVNNFTPPTGPYPEVKDSNNVLLVHADGANNDTYDEDVSSSGNYIFFNADADISTTQSKFGGSSYAFDGTGDYIHVLDGTDFSFGTGNFTIDFWVYYNSHDVSNNSDLIGKATDANNFWRLVTLPNTGGDARKLYFGWYEPSAYKIELKSTTQMSTATWYHVAVVRNGTTFTLYVNGTSEATDTHADSIPQFTGDLEIGKNPYGASEYLNGYMDEIRISKGIARWTAAFTVPSEAYPDYM